MDWYKKIDKEKECVLVVNDYSNKWSEWSSTVSKESIPFVVIQNAQDVQKPIQYMMDNLNHGSTEIFDKIIASTSSRCF